MVGFTAGNRSRTLAPSRHFAAQGARMRTLTIAAAVLLMALPGVRKSDAQTRDPDQSRQILQRVEWPVSSQTSLEEEVIAANYPVGTQWVGFRMDLSQGQVFTAGNVIDYRVDWFDTSINAWRQFSGGRFESGPDLDDGVTPWQQHCRVIVALAAVQGRRMRMTVSPHSKMNIGVLSEYWTTLE